MIRIPSTILFRADEPEAIQCTQCGLWVTAEKADDQSKPWLGRFYWRWNYCPCMAAGVLYAQWCDKQTAENDEARRAHEGRQRDYFVAFPQWEQSARVTRQTFESLRETAGNHTAVSAAQQWIAQSPSHGLLLQGPTGTGKTHLVRAMGHRLLADHRTMLYTSVPYLLERLRPNSGVRMEDVLRLHINADIVIWDDVGAEKETEWTLDRLYLLLDARYEADKPLLATTNWTPEELRMQLGSRITSRLIEMAPIWVVKGPDERIATARHRSMAQGGRS